MSTPVIILNNSAEMWDVLPLPFDVDLARIGLGVGDELGNCLGGDGWMHCKNTCQADDAGDWHDVPNEIEIELFIECSVDCVRNPG
jgi:hypothetical protein